VESLKSDYGTAIRLLPSGEMRVAAELGPQAFAAGTVLRLAPDGSYARSVLASGKPFASVDLRSDPRVSPPWPLLDRGVISGVAAPVLGATARSACSLCTPAAGASSTLTRWPRCRHSPTWWLWRGSRLCTASGSATWRCTTSSPGLPNRALLLDRLEQALARRHARERPGAGGIAVALLDLDGFKAVNDTYGHATGDQLLQAVAERFTAAVRPDDTIARFGGDEFALLCENLPDELTAPAVARRLLEACSKPLVVAGHHFTVTASVGLAVSIGRSPHELNADTLLRDADTALYRAKAQGRDGLQLFDESLQVQAKARQQLEAELSLAIQQDELVMHYQPIRAVDDERVLGVEAFVRWQHPRRGLLPPSAFVPLAEQTGQIVPLGRWVLRAACAQAGQWQRAPAGLAGGQLRIAVNVSPVQLDDPELPELVAQCIASNGLAAGTLALELTETALLVGGEAGQSALNRLTDAGAELSLDDFGTGYSSLTHLARFPIQSLKIDHSFVAGLDRDAKDAAIVSAVIALGAELDVRVIAEGVETPDQLRILQAMGCREVQGFLLDLPDAVPTWVSRAVAGAPSA
jgi:diguanylate cyclase (GGDEF)-like protein